MNDLLKILPNQYISFSYIQLYLNILTIPSELY
nr:MAG TPA: hypothetical protein [Caudoviricetes sp.]